MQSFRALRQLLTPPLSAGGRGPLQILLVWNPIIFVNYEPMQNFRTIGEPFLGEKTGTEGERGEVATTFLKSFLKHPVIYSY